MLKLFWKIRYWIWDLQAWWKYRGHMHAIAKADGDPFDYAIGLKSGAVIYFGSLDIRGDHVHLDDVRCFYLANGKLPGGPDGSFNFDRGMDVKLSEIEWAADAPYGS